MLADAHNSKNRPEIHFSGQQAPKIIEILTRLACQLPAFLIKNVSLLTSYITIISNNPIYFNFLSTEAFIKAQLGWTQIIWDSHLFNTPVRTEQRRKHSQRLCAVNRLEQAFRRSLAWQGLHQLWRIFIREAPKDEATSFFGQATSAEILHLLPQKINNKGFSVDRLIRNSANLTHKAWLCIIDGWDQKEREPEIIYVIFENKIRILNYDEGNEQESSCLNWIQEWEWCWFYQRLRWLRINTKSNRRWPWCESFLLH